MSLPVSGQVAAGGVILATLCTRVLWLGVFYLRLLLLGTAITCKKGLKQECKLNEHEYFSPTSYVYAVVRPPFILNTAADPASSSVLISEVR